MTEQMKTYFHRMYEESERYHLARAERMKEKEALEAADDWDAVHKWYEREEQFKSPFTSGQMKAYRAYRNSSEIECGDPEMSDSLWEREVKDFSDTLRAAGVTTFVLTNQSTGLMEDIHNLEAQGWRLVGTCRLVVCSHRFGIEGTEERLGLRFEIEKEA